MDQSFYTGAVGAHQQLRHLNVHGNNIANVNTFGFKNSKVRFESLMYRGDRRTAEEPTRFGVGTRLLMTSTDYTQGGVADTGNPLDYMIEGDGFFAVADLDTGEITFTRVGAFTIAQRFEETGEEIDGEPVLEPVYYLSDGHGRYVLSTEGGLIRVTDRTATLPVGIFDFGNYDGERNIVNTHFTPVDKNGELWLGTGTLIQGKLEMSNTDLAEELTKVIEAQRAYGLALKLVQTSDEIETTINNLRS